MNAPSREEMHAALVARQGEKNVEKLQAATVAVCGLGGLGSNVSIALARAGVGKLILIDFDCVDVTNLHRQQYKANQVGMEKPQALSANLKEIAPYVELETHFVRVTEENVESLIGNADIVVEAFDNAEAKAMLVNAVLERNAEIESAEKNAEAANKEAAYTKVENAEAVNTKTVNSESTKNLKSENLKRLQYLVAASGMAGFDTANTIQTRRLSKRFYLCGDGVNDVNDGIGLVAPRVMACAAHQAQTVVRLICGMENDG